MTVWLKPALVTFAFVLGYVLSVDPTNFGRIGIADVIADELLPTPPWVTEQNDAVHLARKGDTAAALVVLERLWREHPQDIGIARDFAVISVWAGRDTDAIRIFAAMPSGAQPDYVIEAVALAYRHERQSSAALALYQQGLRQSPGNLEFTSGAIRSLADLGEIAPAITLAEFDLQAHGERLDVLLAAGYAALAQNKPVEALRYIDRAAKLDPDRRDIRHDRIMAINRMGAPQVARQLADESPGVLTAAERRHIDGNAAAALVRWGVFEPPSEALRFAASDRAIEALDVLISRWSQEGDGANDDILRARFDRMAAYRDRVRMADVLAEYEDLRAHDVAVPGYAVLAAADAYLYFRQPELARDIYLHRLEVEPRSSRTRLALFYAYIDLDDFDAAYRHVDTAAADQAIWLHLKGLNLPVENSGRATADLLAANARLYADELAEAHRRVAAMAEAAPNNTRFRSALANIYSARGWPRRAAEEYEISRSLSPRNVATEVGQARNDLLLRDYRKVEAKLADLKRRFPENLEVQRLDRLWQVHNMAELRVNAERSMRSATNAQGGSGVTIGTEIYSAPLDYNWRIFGTESVTHERLKEGEGDFTLRRSGVGAEYRSGDLIASLEGTLSASGSKASETLRSDIDQGRAGARALATWSVNDQWEIGGSAEFFTRDTSLRALSQGITANAASANVTYRESESRALRFNARVTDFSDGNMRTSLAGQHTERLLTQPRLIIDGIVGVAGSQNSADANRPYYNPSQDALTTLGLSITQPIYRRYQFVYDHHLVITPGIYWEQGFGADGVGSAFYEHRVRSDDVIEAGLGVSFGRQTYDGKYESSAAVLFNLRWRL